MTNGEKLKEVFPNMRIDVFVSYVQVVGENYEFNNLYPLKWWNAEYKEPKTGHWKYFQNEKGDWMNVCSNCNSDCGVGYPYNYCPNCGCRMER